MATMSRKPEINSKAAPKSGFIGTALRMKKEADAAIKCGGAARLTEKGYKFLTFDT